MDELVGVEQRVADGQPDGALIVALAAWRERPDPAIGAAVRALSASALGRYAAPRARTKDDFQLAWLEVAASDASLAATGWLAAHLDHLVPVADDRFGLLRPNWMQEKYAALFARVAALRRRCPDPRIADAALALLSAGKHGFWDLASVAQVYQPVLDLLLAAEDPALAGAVREIATGSRSKRATVREWLGQALPPAADVLAARAAHPLPDDVAARWRAVAEPRRRDGSHPRDAAALMREVLGRPADDAVRHVLADALLEVEDPRGELLSLQLGGAGDGDTRARKLVKAHQREWLGADLDDTLTQVVFRRGFLEEASLRTNASASLEVWEAAARDERLATLRVLRQGRGNREHYLRFVVSEQARDLRRVEIPTHGFIDALADAPPRAIEALVFGKVPQRPQIAKLAAASSLAAVRSLSLPAPLDLNALCDELGRAGLDGRIDTLLELRFEGAKAKADGAVLPRLGWLGERLPGLREVRLVAAAGGIALLREADGWTMSRTAPEESRSTAFAGGLVVPDQDAFWKLVPWQGALHGQLPPRPPDVVRVKLDGVEVEVAERIVAEWGCEVERTA
jgi:uncharacterized protein (TIGR02996 family)